MTQPETKENIMNNTEAKPAKADKNVVVIVEKKLVAKDSHGFTATTYVTDAVRGLTRAAGLMPEIADECNEILALVIPLQDKVRTRKVTKRTKEQITADRDRLNKQLAAMPD